MRRRDRASEAKLMEGEGNWEKGGKRDSALICNGHVQITPPTKCENPLKINLSC